MKNTFLKASLLLIACAFSAFPMYAQSDDIPRVTNAYVLQNLTVITSPGDTLKNASVLMEDGLIREVGADIPRPAHAKLIECEGMFAYPGFIEAISHTGVPSPKSDNNGERPRVEDPGNPPNDLAGIMPGRSVADVYNASDKSIGAKRELGFTVAHTVPREGMLPGTGALMLLGEGGTAEMTIRESVSLYAQFQPARRMYPATVIGVMAKWRDLYRQAEILNSHKSAFDDSPNGGLERPRYDKAIEGMFPVVNGDVPVFFKTPGSSDVRKAMLLHNDLEFDLVLSEVDEAWMVADAVADMEIPVLLTLDLPEDKAEKSKGDEEKESDPEKEALEKRRTEFLQKHCGQAAELASKGIPFSFSTLEVKERNIRENLRLYIENGLSENGALAALTTVPAEMLGVSGYLGTISPGKMANIVVTTDNYFSEDANVRYVFVEGEMFEYEIKEKKKSDKNGDESPTANLNGNWSWEVDVMGQVQKGTLSFSGNDGLYQGSIMSADDDESRDLREIEVDGSRVTFLFDADMDGQSMTIEFDLEVTDDIFEGDVKVGQFGSFPVEGEKDPDSSRKN